MMQDRRRSFVQCAMASRAHDNTRRNHRHIAAIHLAAKNVDHQGDTIAALGSATGIGSGTVSQ